MTSKDLISIMTSQSIENDKSIHVADGSRKHYVLRSSRKISKMRSKTRRFSANNKKMCLSKNSVVNIKRLPRSVLDTSVTTPSEPINLPKKACFQKSSDVVKPNSSNVDVSELLQDEDFLNLSDMVRMFNKKNLFVSRHPIDIYLL